MDVDIFGFVRAEVEHRKAHLGALRFAWSLMTWEQRMAFRARYPALARELARK